MKNLKKLVISSKIKIRETQPECILIFDPERDFFYEFNSTGSELFLLLKKGLSFEKIIDFLAEEYGLSREEAKKELNSFVERLKKLKVVE